MLIKKLSLVGLILLVFAAFPITVSASSAAVEDVALELICQCGCNAVLSNCTHGECMVRDGMKQSIEQQLSNGQSKDQIIATFVKQYGEVVLSLPPKKGFNLTAWIAPFAAIIIGAVVIWIAIKKWVRRGSETVLEPVTIESAKAEEENAKYLSEVEKDLKEFGERGFR